MERLRQDNYNILTTRVVFMMSSKLDSLFGVLLYLYSDLFGFAKHAFNCKSDANLTKVSNATLEPTEDQKGADKNNNTLSINHCAYSQQCWM